MELQKAPKYFLKTLVPLIFVAHVGFILKFDLDPESFDTRIYKRSVEEIDFPLIFKLCAHEKTTKTSRTYRKLGYKNAYDFYAGTSVYNISIVGWNGHGRNESTLATTKGNHH